MISRMILPNFIVSQFIPPAACEKCGRSDLSFTVLAPQFAWKGERVELNYPLRCPCGGVGHIPVQLPTLFFGYILANIAIIDAARMRRSKAMMTVRASSDNKILEQIVGRFNWLMQPCNCAHKFIQTSELDFLRNAAAIQRDRKKFGFDQDEWAQFMRRLGFDEYGHDSK